NSLLALDAEMLGFLAAALDRHQESEIHHARASAHRERIREHFWDDSRGIFANRLWSGNFVRSLAPTSFFPLLAGAARPAQIASLARHLSSARSFGGKWGLPSVVRSDPAFADNVYWRGRIWPILNWLVWLGLKRSGLASQAETLRKKSCKLFSESWRLRLAPENFHAHTGEGLDQPDTDPFYSWTALLPLMGVADLVDVDPWKGWCLRTDGGDIEIGPVTSPLGGLRILRRRGWTEVRLAEDLLFATDIVPELTGIEFGEKLALMLPARLRGGASFRTSRTIASAQQNGRPLLVPAAGGIRLQATASRPERLEIAFAK
ncbi:MAG TPA: trehalase family glycosidase, partial [Sphingomonadales bacterium]|nr:trehalase family glycosidase [Sphingomonadales bacterium]